MKYWILAFVMIFSCATGCKNDDAAIRKKFSTKKKNRCIPVNRTQYASDSLLIFQKFRDYVGSRVDIYSADAYDAQTIIYIDTILFDSSHKYGAVLLITKTFNNYIKEKVYNGVVHYISMGNGSSGNLGRWKIYLKHGALHINAESYGKISGILRSNNFVYRSFAANQNNEIGYNLDDCRFWQSDEFKKDIQGEGFARTPLNDQ